MCRFRRRLFDQFVNLLRLLSDSNVFAVFEETRCRVLHGGHSSVSIRPGMNPRMRGGKESLLDENDANHLKKLWKNVAEGANREKVRLALKRFGDTAERMSAEDKLIDYWIALESLFAPESSSEIRYRAALRIASYLGEGEERSKIYRDVGLSYDFRSAVVHANRGRLGCVDILSQPDERTGELEESQISSVQFVKPGAYPAKVLYLVDEALH